jgi:ribosomal-protein-alanine N-acetyltransferase
MPPPTTPRLRLREFAENTVDSAFLLKVLNDPAFIANVADRGVRTEAEALTYMRERIVPSYGKNGFGMWVVELQSGVPIGICGLLKRDTLRDIDLGFSFLEAYRGHGYASEAASATLDYGWQTANLSRIAAITAPHNTRSIRLLEKLGMHFENMIQLGDDKTELMLFAAERSQ